MGKNPAHGIGVQRRVADAAGSADLPEQRPGPPFGHRLPSVEGQHRAGLGVPAARQADLRPLPGLVGLAPADAQPQPAGDHGHVLDLQRHQL